MTRAIRTPARLIGLGMALALAGDLLSLARGEAPEGAGQETIDLRTLLTDLCDSSHPRAQAKSIGLTCSVPEGLCLRGDPP